MRLIGLAVVAALGFATQSVRAFTNGTLLPSYLCNNPDGYPKSAGTLIPFLQLGTAADNYNQFPPGNNTKVTIAIGATPPVAGAAIAPTARQIIGAFHNGGAQEDAAGNTITPQVYEKASVQPVWLAPVTADPVTGLVTNSTLGYVITPGAVHTFVVAAHCPAPDIRGYDNAGVALDGFFAYAVDTGTGQRVGSWINVGPTMTNWYACAIGANVSASVGIVHNQLVSGNPNVAGLTWQAPANITGLIKFMGAGVSDCAYGPFNVTYNVTTTAAKGVFALSPTAQGLNPNKDTANVVAAYTAKDTSADLPQTLATATYVGTPAVPQAFAAAPPTTTTATTGYTPGATAGIAIAGAVGGGLVVGAAMFFVGRRQTSTNKAPLLL
eukprot:TRINITY_DN7428_c0_g2_i3.p1 TRINITY_DN7428_c0_g2~~TRINITY_DN7428_c0_g2_i3.p1  ORF type:complete len:382 (-),score=114.44 TRINITY_DN7428_c0_g2_i3:118-1263(-)